MAATRRLSPPPSLPPFLPAPSSVLFAVHVRGEQIDEVRLLPRGTDRASTLAYYTRNFPELKVLEYGRAVVAPAPVDLHVHLNAPGRDWEGLDTGSRAAAAGGLAALMDMPLNSYPAATTATLLRAKIKHARESPLKVDVGFWGGIVPQNAHDPGAIRALASAGARGFKSFMSPSGMEDFDHVAPEDVRAALPTLRAMGLPYMIHAELVDRGEDVLAAEAPEVPAGSFAAHVAKRPKRFELNAIAAIIDALRATKNSITKPGFEVRIAHLASPEALEAIAAARAEGLELSVETCPHYLLLAQETIPDGDPLYKCMPPIRDEANRRRLVEAVLDGDIDSLGSDHSPAPAHLRLLREGNVRDAWGGIAGLQYAIPAAWEALAEGAERTNGSAAALDRNERWAAKASPQDAALATFARAAATSPAAFARLPKRGEIAAAKDADLVVFDPDALADTSAGAREHRHKETLYDGMKLRGKVLATFVRGHQVFDAERGVAEDNCGRVLVG